MKSFFYFSLIIFSYGSIHSQSYQFEHLNLPYEKLTTTSTGHMEHPFNGGVAQLVLAGGPYGYINTFGTTFNLDTDTVRINVNGNVDFFNEDYFAIYDGAMLPIRSIDNFSKIAYYHIHSDDAHKLVFQWENCGFDGLPDNYTINFQMHFDLSSGDFWVHYGEVSNVTAEPQIGLALLDPALTGFYEVYFLGGESNAPVVNNWTVDYLNNVPIEGSIYKWTNLNQVSISENVDLGGTTIFPNPAHNFIQFHKTYTSVKIVDMLGSVMLQSREKNNILDISSIHPGVYFLFVEFEDGDTTTEKVWIK